MNLPFLIAALQSPAVPAAEAAVKDLVAVAVRDGAAAERLLRLASDPLDEVPPTAEGEFLILAGDAEQARLQDAGFALRVLQEDLAGFYAARAAAERAPRGVGGSMGGFKTLAEIHAELNRLSSSYPAIVSPRFSLGSSHEGRAIYAIRISDNPTVDEAAEPVAWFDALHHAREPMSGEALLLFADWLCSNYGTDPTVTRIVNSRNVLVVPCVNPDGYEYNRLTEPNGGGLWRKNRRNNGGGSFGVDLNRNYSYEWGPQWPGSSGDPDSDVYRGPAPFSEPETAALRDRMALHPPRMSISAHTFADVWLYSWGYNSIYTGENNTFRYYGDRMTAGNGYPFGTVWEILYIANGGSVDYHYGVHGTYAFTPEIGGGNDGFWPSPARIPALFEDVRPGFTMVAQWSGAWAERGTSAYSQVSGDGDAFLEPGETWNLNLPYSNAGTLAASLSLLLTSSSPDVIVESAGAAVNVPVRGSATAPPLRLRFAAGALLGQPYTLQLAETWEGVTTTTPLTVILGGTRLLLRDDMELADFGWSASNATNWSWERAVPQPTSSGGETVQPGSDNPAGNGTRCWVTGAAAGGSAGSNDVDGTTRLTSPRFSAAGFGHLELSYARWFANQPGSNLDDELLVEVSNNDGATWTVLETTGNANAWTTVRFDLENYVALGDQMRLRFTAADDPNNDLTEAALDDLELRVSSGLPTLGVWGQVSLNASVRLLIDGPPAVPYELRYSFTRGPGATVGGIDGLSYLTGNVRTLLSGNTGGSGLVDTLLTVPNTASLSGRTVHLQALLDLGGAEAAWSNLLSVVVL